MIIRKEVKSMKWYICELSKDESEMFKSFLRDNGIKFESCQCYNGVMVSVFCDEETMNRCNSFIDTL